MRFRFASRACCVALSGLVAFGSGVAGATMVERYEGTAFDTRGRELYRESHYLSGAEGARNRLVLYLCPDGKAFARKRVDENGRPEAPLFELEDARTSYREGVRLAADGKAQVFVQSGASALERQSSMALGEHTVIDAGVDAFIRANWDVIRPGNRAELDFLVPSRLDTVAFVVSDRGDQAIGSAPVRRFRLELGAWYGFALPSIDIAYDARTRALREYSGVANIRDSAGSNLTVRIAFPSTPPQPSTLDLLARAERAPLDGRCSF